MIYNELFWLRVDAFFIPGDLVGFRSASEAIVAGIGDASIGQGASWAESGRASQDTHDWPQSQPLF